MRQLWNCPYQRFLRRIFRIFAVTADLHAEGEGRLLQQTQRPLQRIAVSLTQFPDRSLEVRLHPFSVIPPELMRADGSRAMNLISYS